MNEQDNFEFNFDEKIEDILSSTRQPEIVEYEDIVSDSGKNREPSVYEDISSYSKQGKRKAKKGRWKNMKGWKKGLIIGSTSLVLVVAILFGAVYLYVYNMLKDIQHYDLDDSDLGIVGGHIDEDVINIALFGVDSRDPSDFTGLSDSIMILSLNTDTKTIKIFSVMRDTLVPMYDDEGNRFFGKINSAYKNSPERAIRTLNQVFKLDIEDFATVNFFGMIDIIDAVGGIEATITEDELRWHGYDNPNLNNCMDEICNEKGLDANDYYIKKTGKQKLNGVQAVAYSRVRHCRSTWGTNNDYGRTDRQRHVMQELFNRAISISTTKYPSLIKALVPCTITSLKPNEIISLAVNMLGGSSSFEQYRIPQNESGKNMTFTGPSGYGSVVYFDIDYASDLIKGIIYDDYTLDEFIEENPIQKNDWYKEMGGKVTTQRPTPNQSNNQSIKDDKPPTTSENQTPDSSENTNTCEHKNTEVCDRVEATQEAEGYTGNTYCKDCGEKISDGEVIKKLEPNNSQDGPNGEDGGDAGGNENDGDQGGTGGNDGQGGSGGNGETGGDNQTGEPAA